MSESINNIISSLKNQKPHSKWYFRWLNIALILLIILIGVGGSFLIAFYFWDILQGPRELAGIDTWTLVGHSLFELLAAALLLSALIYLLYRHTDWPLVRKRWLLMGAIWAVFILIASGIFLAGEQNEAVKARFEIAQQELDRLPYRPKRLENLYRGRPEPGRIVGRIVEIKKLDNDPNKLVIELRNRFETRKFTVQKDMLIGFDKGIMVEIVVKPGSNEVLDIKPLPPKGGQVKGERERPVQLDGDEKLN